MAIIKSRQEQPGEYQTQINTEVQPFPTVAGTATTTISLGNAPRLQLFNQGFVSQTALIIPTSGTVTAQIGKYDSTAAFAKVPLTAATNLVTGQTAKKNAALPALATLTDAQKQIQVADSLYVDFVASAAVTTQAVGGIVGVELFILK